MSVDAKVPLLASASGTGAGVPHTLWRPQMQTFLMRHGIEDRDYAREIAQWRELAAAVEADAEEEEQAAITTRAGRRQQQQQQQQQRQQRPDAAGVTDHSEERASGSPL